MSSKAIAQPQTEPPAVIDLGVISVDGPAIRTAPITITNGQNLWFKFRVSQTIRFDRSWLAINTTGSTIATDIGLYDSQSSLIAFDLIGSGGGNTSALAAGSGSGLRMGDVGEAGAQGRLGTSQNSGFNWAWLNYLTADRPYYLVVVGNGADFSQTFNPNWLVSTSFIGSGTSRVYIRAGTKSSSVWHEHYQGGTDGAVQLDTAATPEGSGPLTKIIANLGAQSRDMFKIRVCDASAFRVTATASRDAGGSSRMRMFMFNELGRGIVAINNTTTSTTELTLPAGSTNGIYYIAISNNCPGQFAGTQNTAYSNDNMMIWDFTNSSSWNRPLTPNGPGASATLATWALPSACDGGQAYWVSLDMQGACYIDQGCNSIDFNNDGLFPSDEDLIDFLRVLAGGECRL